MILWRLNSLSEGEVRAEFSQQRAESRFLGCQRVARHLLEDHRRHASYAEEPGEAERFLECENYECPKTAQILWVKAELRS